MALLLFGGIGNAISEVSTHITNELSETYDNVTKPIYEYFDTADKDKDERLKEEIRQESIDKIKKKYENDNKVREKCGMKTKKYGTTIINNTDFPCTIVYVNMYFGITHEKAIEWAKKVINVNYIEIGVLNKLNTKKTILPPNSNISIIGKEINEYFIVLNIQDQFIVLNKINLNDESVIIKDLFKQ